MLVTVLPSQPTGAPSVRVTGWVAPRLTQAPASGQVTLGQGYLPRAAVLGGRSSPGHLWGAAAGAGLEGVEDMGRSARILLHVCCGRVGASCCPPRWDMSSLSAAADVRPEGKVRR